MCSNIKFDIFLDRSNIQELVLRLAKSQGGTAITDLSSFTRMIFTVDSYSVDSSTAPTAIWWDDSETRTITIDGAEESFTGDVVKIQAGPELATAGLTAGVYENCCLVVYSTTHVEGAVYADDIEVTAIDTCED